MELLGDVGHVESHFSLSGDSGSIGERSFWMHVMVLLGNEAQVEA
jgi:hypothetical protein